MNEIGCATYEVELVHSDSNTYRCDYRWWTTGRACGRHIRRVRLALIVAPHTTVARRRQIAGQTPTRTAVSFGHRGTTKHCNRNELLYHRQNQRIKSENRKCLIMSFI